MNITSKHTGLLALAVTFSAGIHAALVPEHLKEMPPLMQQAGHKSRPQAAQLVSHCDA